MHGKLPAEETLPCTFEVGLAAPDLQPYFLGFWEATAIGEEPVKELLFPEWSNLRITLSGEWHIGRLESDISTPTLGIALQGVAKTPQWTSGKGGAVFSVGILPTAAKRFFGVNAEKVADKTIPLADLVGGRANRFRTDLQEAPDFQSRVEITNAFLLRLLEETPPDPNHDALISILQSINHPDCTTVADMVDATGISQPRMARLTRASFGFTPKVLLQRQRFLRMARSMHGLTPSNWRDFMDPQYVDQSHMIRDFKRFIGLSPTRYFALKRPFVQAARRQIIAKMMGEGADHFRMEEGRLQYVNVPGAPPKVDDA
jgi:AraC-like DNA-binding protein